MDGFVKKTESISNYTQGERLFHSSQLQLIRGFLNVESYQVSSRLESLSGFVSKYFYQNIKSVPYRTNGNPIAPWEILIFINSGRY